MNNAADKLTFSSLDPFRLITFKGIDEKSNKLEL